MSKSIINSHQCSLTEWFSAIGEDEESKQIRDEDNSRINRFRFLQEIGVTCDVPVEFPAVDLINKTPDFLKLLEKQGDLPSAIRLVPNNSALPKLRDRGLPLRQCYEEWFLKQDIDHTQYTAEIFRHHPAKKWSATFVVKEDGIFGVVVQGLASQLTQGDTTYPTYEFVFDFKNWQWSEENSEVVEVAKKMVEVIRITDQTKQRAILEKMGMVCFHNYLEGYFEVTVPEDNLFLFIDYNRLLHKKLKAYNIKTENNTEYVTGTTVFPGKAIGRVVVVDEKNLGSVEFKEGDILVCDNTDVRHLPLMRLAGAIITDRGGILSHAAIIARELSKVCLVGAKNATKQLKTGDMIEVDADRGTIKML